MTLPVIIICLAAVAFLLGYRRAVAHAEGKLASLHSRPGHHGWFVALLCVGPALLIWVAWTVFEGTILRTIVESSLTADVIAQGPEMLGFFMTEVKRLGLGLPPTREVTPEIEQAGAYYGQLVGTSRIALYVVVLALVAAAMPFALGKLSREFRARNKVEHWVTYSLLLAAGISILTTAGIVFSVLYESILFFQKVSITSFLFGLEWSPQTALRADQVGASGSFGAIPLFAGTLLITFMAMLVAGPIGLLSAIYLAEYATPHFRTIAKPIMEILAGVPTVVYGFFAALTVAPFVRNLGASVGLDVASESALAAGAVMGIMIIPFISSLSDDALTAVPQALRDASYGLGATTAETISKVVLPAALPGIIAGFLLAISRAIGETMIVVMAAGLAANLTANPLDAVTTVTVQIVTLLVGDQEFDSAKTLAAFALGLMLFVTTLGLNVLALHVMQKYREKYD